MTTFDLKIAAGARGCLIDTSIWVEALRSRDHHIAHPVTPVIQEISEADFIYTSRLIVAEIMTGARTKREAERLEEDLRGFPFAFAFATKTWLCSETRRCFVKPTCALLEKDPFRGLSTAT